MAGPDMGPAERWVRKNHVADQRHRQVRFRYTIMNLKPHPVMPSMALRRYALTLHLVWKGQGLQAKISELFLRDKNHPALSHLSIPCLPNPRSTARIRAAIPPHLSMNS